MTARGSSNCAKAAGAVMVEGPFLDFLDPWGNRHRDHRVFEHPVHQGAERAARHGPRARQERQGQEGTRRQGDGAGMSTTQAPEQNAAEPDRPRPAPARRYRRPFPRRYRTGEARRGGRVRRHRQGLALQRAPVRISAADPVSRLLRRRRAETAADLRSRAVAVAQAARSRRTARDIGHHVGRQTRVRLRHRLSRCRVQGVRRAARRSRQAFRGRARSGAGGCGPRIS